MGGQVHGVEVDGLAGLPEDELVFLEAVGLLVVRLLQVQLQELSKHRCSIITIFPPQPPLSISQSLLITYTSLTQKYLRARLLTLANSFLDDCNNAEQTISSLIILNVGQQNSSQEAMEQRAS